MLGNERHQLSYSSSTLIDTVSQSFNFCLNDVHGQVPTFTIDIMVA